MNLSGQESKKDSNGTGDVVFHFVGFGFLPECTEKKVEEILHAFIGLGDSIPEVLSLNCGPNNSPENLNGQCTHGFILTFANEKDRDAYLIHTKHLEFVELVKDNLAEVFVLDFTG